MAGKEAHSSECVGIYPLMWDEEEKTPLIPSVAITIDGGEIKTKSLLWCVRNVM